LENVHFQDEFSDVEEDFCDVEGLDITRDVVVDFHILVNSRGPDQLPYLHENVDATVVFTNPATGARVTSIERTVSRDHVITDNGDGTFTITVLATGNATLSDSSGKALARNPGQVRFQILVDHNGTPTDPSDDEFVEFLGIVFGSTGRNDDFCAAALPALT
jgi:hypothetical protein